MVLHCSNLRRVKRIDLLLESASLIRPREAFKLVILAGEDFSPYVDIVDRLGLGGRVIVLDRVRDVRGLPPRGRHRTDHVGVGELLPEYPRSNVFRLPECRHQCRRNSRGHRRRRFRHHGTFRRCGGDCPCRRRTDRGTGATDCDRTCRSAACSRTILRRSHRAALRRALPPSPRVNLISHEKPPTVWFPTAKVPEGNGDPVGPDVNVVLARRRSLVPGGEPVLPGRLSPGDCGRREPRCVGAEDRLEGLGEVAGADALQVRPGQQS